MRWTPCPVLVSLLLLYQDANSADVESITAAIRTDEERARGNDRFGRRGDDFLSSRRMCAPIFFSFQASLIL
jgi:hypothetical protein